MLHVLIRGIDSERMRRLFETEKLDLAKAIQMCQTIEATTADLQSWEAKELSEQVAAVKDERCEEDEVAMVRNRGVPVKGKESRYEGMELDRREREEQECWRCRRCHRLHQCPCSVWAKVPQVQWSQPLCKKVQAEKQTNPVGPRAGNRRITADQGREKREKVAS